jgi:hypothetical protein
MTAFVATPARDRVDVEVTTVLQRRRYITRSAGIDPDSWKRKRLVIATNETQEAR